MGLGSWFGLRVRGDAMGTSLLRLAGVALSLLCFEPEASAQESKASGNVKLQFKTSPLTHNDQEIEVLRVKPDGTTETVTDSQGRQLKGKPGDLAERGKSDQFELDKDEPKKTPRVTQDTAERNEDVFTIRLQPGTYVIRITDPTNPEADQSMETPKFKVGADKVKIGVRLAPGSKEAGNQVEIDKKY